MRCSSSEAESSPLKKINRWKFWRESGGFGFLPLFGNPWKHEVSGGHVLNIKGDTQCWCTGNLQQRIRSVSVPQRGRLHWQHRLASWGRRGEFGSPATLSIARRRPGCSLASRFPPKQASVLAFEENEGPEVSLRARKGLYLARSS